MQIYNHKIKIHLVYKSLEKGKQLNKNRIFSTYFKPLVGSGLILFKEE